MGQQPPGGPQKSRTGLIIAAVVGGIAVLVILVVVTVLATRDDDGDDDGPSTTTSEESDPTEEPTDEPTEDPTDEPTDEPTEDAPDGDVLAGDGYSYSLPEGWQDITASEPAAASAPTIDSITAPGASIAESSGNLIVENPPAGGASDEDALGQLEEVLGQSIPDATIEQLEPREIGGVEMLGLGLTRENELGITVEQTAYVTVLDDVIYVVTASRSSDDPDVDDAFEEAYASWSWE